MIVFFRGTYRTILLAPDAETTLEEAAGNVPPNKREACVAQLFRVLQRLGNFETVRNKELFRSEGQGIFAVKSRCGLRGYGWFETLHDRQRVFVVSHFILKKKQKTDPKDVDRAVATRNNLKEAS